MLKEMICIVCPIGCRLTVDDSSGTIEVSGNTCPRGKQYAINELSNPTRTLTTTVEIENAIYHQLPVISTSPIPLDKIKETMLLLKGVKVKAPIYEKDIIVNNIFNLRIDIIASRDMKEIKENDE